MLDIQNILVCPVSKQKLTKQDGTYTDPHKQKHYKIVDDIGIFLTEDLNEIKKVETETYSQRAEEFSEDETQIMHMRRPEFTKPMRDLGKDGVFLEIACGSAAHGLNMLKDGYKVIESDIAIGTVSKVKQFAHKLKVDNKASFAVIDAEYLPFADNSLSGIYMIASLHHIPTPAKALKEFKRCLKPGGVVLIGYEPSNWQYIVFGPVYKMLRFFIRKMYKNRLISLADDHTFGFSKRKLAKLLKEADLEVISIKPVHFTYKTYQNWLILWGKIFKKEFKEVEGLAKILKAIDKVWAKIPVLRGLTWDWDALGRKKI